MKKALTVLIFSATVFCGCNNGRYSDKTNPGNNELNSSNQSEQDKSQNVTKGSSAQMNTDSSNTNSDSTNLKKNI